MYRFLGISKQVVHSLKKRQLLFDQELSLLVQEVDAIREEHPGCGLEKIYYSLAPKLIGRDKFIEIFMDLGYRIKKVKNYCRTTYPSHINYPNLIEGMIVHEPFQVIQSDITYFDLKGKFYYIIFIVDVYTREILSHKVSSHMRAEANIEALKDALKKIDKKEKNIIHHSDRGTQYGSNAYRQILINNGIGVSMGLIAQDNAFAERVNGTIKNEYLKRWIIENEKDLKQKTKKAVSNYNEKRIHNSLRKRISPSEFKKTLVNLTTQKRPMVIIYAEGNKEIKKAFSHLDFCPKKEPLAHNCPYGKWGVNENIN